MKKSRIAIIGSGVIGEAAGKGFLKYDADVVFCDIDEEKLERLKKEGHTAIKPSELKNHAIDIFLISIQTPTTDEGVNLVPLTSALESIGEAIKLHSGYPVIATRSTVPVGTAKKLVAPTLEKYSGKKAWKDFGVCSNPEYLRELVAFDDFLNARLVVLGCEDEKSKEILEEMYRPLGAPIYHGGIEEAEMQKYTHNLFNAVKISFFNEQRRICEVQGISADAIFPLVVESAEGLWNPRYGTKNLGPYGGACLPKDIKGFIKRAKDDLGLDLPMLEAAEEINEKLKKECNE